MERNFLIDNVKGVLACLVLLAHTPPLLSINNIPLEFKMVIHCVIMPSFIFYSGILSKKLDRRLSHSFRSILIPYLVFTIINHKSLSSLYDPRGILWYLLALYFIIFGVSQIVKVKYSLLWACLISVSGFYFFDIDSHNFLCVGIALSMAPMFLVGYYTPISKIEYLHNKKVFSIAIGLLSIVFIALLTHLGYIYWRFRPHFYHSTFNEEFLKIVVCVLSLGTVLLINALVPAKSCRLSKIGQYSIVVYLLHPYLYRFIGKLYMFDNDIYNLLMAILVSIFSAYLLSINKVKTIFDLCLGKVSDLILK